MIPFLLLATLQIGPGWFPFVIPWDDSSASATDMSFLSHDPAGAHGRIVASQGHFVELESRIPIRFLGVNITAGAAFPSHDDADHISAHLAKMGINLVRFHHLQNDWLVASGGSIWKPGRVYRDLDPVQLDKLDYFIAALKKHGIYSNLNLQTTRRYLPEMGFPPSVLQIPMSFDKMIDKVDRHMIELQKLYARDLLDRTNPYTGHRYADEPALAMVEINNENSLVGWPGESPGQDLGSLPDPFKQEIVIKWNDWLARHYADDLAIGRAWTSDLPPSGPSILGPDTRWTSENHNAGGSGFISAIEFKPSPSPGVAPAISVGVTANEGPDWWQQIHLLGLTLKNGSVYTLSFRAKASRHANLSVMAGLDEADWRNVGLSAPLEVGPAWREYSMPFTVHDAVPGHDRICFVIGNLRGDLNVDGLTLKPGIDAGAPLGGGSLATRSIPLPQRGLPKQMQDFATFLTETETAFSTEMRDYLRKDLGIKANLIDSQVSWGGYTSFVREAGSDYADNHAYWQHPSFPGKDWDPVNWLIQNKPMVDEIPNGGDVLTNLARYRMLGKPYSISEYNEPAPNDYRVETLPLLSTFAAHQGWDAIYLFEYGQFGTGKENDRIQGFFDSGVDPAKAAFLPSAAMLFRETEVPADGLVVSEVEHPLWRNGQIGDAGWSFATVSPLEVRYETALEGRHSLELDLLGAIRCTVDIGPRGPVYRYDGHSRVAVGHLGGTTVRFTRRWIITRPGPGGPPSAPAMSFRFPEFGNGFGALTLVPIHERGHFLLTLASRAENQGMGWNKDRSSVGDKWGHGPVMAEGVPCDLTIEGGGILHAWALDATGHRVRQVPVTSGHGPVTIHVGPEYETLWYELGP